MEHLCVSRYWERGTSASHNREEQSYEDTPERLLKDFGNARWRRDRRRKRANRRCLPNGEPIGFQTYEIFKNLTDDWQGTWNTMAGMGYKFADLDYFGVIAQHTPDDINQTFATTPHLHNLPLSPRLVQ